MISCYDSVSYLGFCLILVVLFQCFMKHFKESILFKGKHFQLRWCQVRDLFGSQIPVTTGGFELRISCIRSNNLTNLLHMQEIRSSTFLLSLEFIIQINFEHHTIAVWNLALSISTRKYLFKKVFIAFAIPLLTVLWKSFRTEIFLNHWPNIFRYKARKILKVQFSYDC